MMEKVMVSITKEMKDALEEQRKKRLLDSIPETIRVVLSEYLAKLDPLTPMVLGDFYFEIGAIENVVRVAAFVTPNKPNLMSKPIPNEAVRMKRLMKLFVDLSHLRDYKVETEPVGMLLAQSTSVDVPGIRINISRKDKVKITTDEVVELIKKNIA